MSVGSRSIGCSGLSSDDDSVKRRGVSFIRNNSSIRFGSIGQARLLCRLTLVTFDDSLKRDDTILARLAPETLLRERASIPLL